VGASLDHDAVVAALQERLGDYWTVTVRSARPQKAEPKDDAPPGETDFVWYVGADENTFGAFAIPREGFGRADWESTEKGSALMVQSSDVLIALFPRSVDDE